MSRVAIQPFDQGASYRALVEAHGTPLLVLDCQKILAQYQILREQLPGVKPYYAIKSQPFPTVIAILKNLGSGFDIATSGEIGLLYPHWAGARDVIHTHPIKRDKDIRDALRYGCTTFVVDNPWELEKFVEYRHRVGLLLRVSFPNPDTPIDLSRKFGCRPEEALGLIQQAESLGIHIKGLSFHAGSQSPSPANHVHGIDACRQLIDAYNQREGKILSVLDIGGGFPVNYRNPLENIDLDGFFAPIRQALRALHDDLTVIAEPGRFISAPAGTSITRVMGKAKRNDSTWYYFDDGLYGSYSGQLYDHATYPLTVFSDDPTREPATFAGPTCDSIDVIAEDVLVPPLAMGDLLVGEQMGAYTNASATDFNLFEKAKIIAINPPS